ncbi:TPA: CaiF/GrlA family transcriptional regulator, partial [Salmonella enterica]|nr:CaiF/GrlA family transcriptional regulator [Salmonella enterica]EBP3414820.1 CaiF/GrlA family transcriptional regulator [Salmonella enterica subsp. diarizonae]EAS2302605.1 CaiF/GrlA family transcriptional regulator [Salmonella enterica]EAU0298716.1 CaiF/GrlA family transcriptional regulator [Salmonella enterica]EAX6962091.1 CaiF/GrlA family transcriptional regulator [Salmonella enterica]
TNHDACFIPECVRQYNGEPLYILVAHWCLLQQNWVQRSQISEAFHITARRASYLMSYLRNKASRVVCVCRRQTLSNKAQRYEIFVVRVLENPEPARRERTVTPPVSRRRVGNGDRAQANELWNRLCSNRNAGKILKKEDDDDGV